MNSKTLEIERGQTSERQLSGETVYATVTCPNCEQTHGLYLPIEYYESCVAWRTHNGNLRILCSVCRRWMVKR